MYATNTLAAYDEVAKLSGLSPCGTCEKESRDSRPSYRLWIEVGFTSRKVKHERVGNVPGPISLEPLIEAEKNYSPCQVSRAQRGSARVRDLNRD